MSSKQGWEVVHLVQYTGLWKGQMLSIRWKIAHTEQLQIFFFTCREGFFQFEWTLLCFKLLKLYYIFSVKEKSNTSHIV